MVTINLTMKLDQQALRDYLADYGATKVQAVARKVADQAKVEISTAPGARWTGPGRVNTGQMRNATVAETVQLEGNLIRGRVVTEVAHAEFQHEGTAGNGTGYIVPRRARVLRFPVRGVGMVFAPRVRGVVGHKFLRRAAERLLLEDFT